MFVWEPEFLFTVSGRRRPNAGAPAVAVCGTTDRRARMLARLPPFEGICEEDGSPRAAVSAGAAAPARS
jgi:hypothetical protein